MAGLPAAPAILALTSLQSLPFVSSMLQTPDRKMTA